MGADEMQLPRIDFSGIDPSAPGTGPWPAVRAQVMDALATFGCFDAHYPALTPELRDALFDGAAKPLFALPLDVKRRNYHGPELPFHGHLGGRPGLDGYMSLGIVNGNKAEHIRSFADLMWPGGDGDGDGGVSARFWYGSHQDANLLSIVCQHEVDGLEVQTKDGEWYPIKLSPTSLVVMVGNALRAWSNERLHSPFHRITTSGDSTRYSSILFSVPRFVIQAPDELVDDEHPPRFKRHDYEEFVRFCVSEEGASHYDKLKAYCGV
ncbi:hypothetical protein ACP4OV_021479 [Aristida adscensionis]